MGKLIELKWLLISEFCILSFLCSGQKTVFISPSGNDAGDGTLKHPLLSLQKARDVARERKASGEKGSFTIFCRGGDYCFVSPVELGEQDNNLTIAPYKNEKVRFTGGISIDPRNIRPVVGSGKENIFPLKNRNFISMVSLRDLGINKYGQLKQVGFNHPISPAWMEVFINGKPGHLSRWPNDSVISLGKVIDKGSVAAEGDKDTRGGKFTYPGNHPSGWKASDDIWIFGYFRYGWADDAVKLASIDTVEKTFTTVQPHLYGYSSGKSWNAWYAYNIPEETDSPGEYCIDRKEGILYFYNPGKIEKLEVSVLEEPFISMKAASDITIQGITFECTREICVEIKSSCQCLLKDCLFRNIGTYAVNIADEQNGKVGKKNGLYRCRITQAGAGGIKLGGGNRQTLEAAGNYAEDCSISVFNRIYQTYCPGIQITGVGNCISHCEISDAPHFAVQLSGNDHLIEYNDIHDVCKVTDDVGALYYGRNPSERGNLVRYNYFHHISDVHSSSAVYHDDGACGMKVFGNVFYRAGSIPVLIGGGNDNLYMNNIFIDCPIAIHVDDRLLNWAKDWITPGNLFEKELNEIKYNQPPYSTKYPELTKYWDESPGLPKRNVVDKNVFINIGKVIKGNKSWLEYSDNNWVTNEDPEFVNREKQNFMLKRSSVVYKKVPGFQAIPFHSIGIRKKIMNDIR